MTQNFPTNQIGSAYQQGYPQPPQQPVPPQQPNPPQQQFPYQNPYQNPFPQQQQQQPQFAGQPPYSMYPYQMMMPPQNQPPPPRVDSQPENSKPSHTVFFYNVGFSVTDEEMAEFAKQYGEVFYIFCKIRDRGQSFVTYYDIRCAERAVNETNGKRFAGRNVHCNFAYHPQTKDRMDPRLFSSAIIVNPRAPRTPPLNQGEITQIMSKYGDVRVVENDGSAFIVRFYDIRSAKSAMETGRVQDDEFSFEYKVEEEEERDSRRGRRDREDRGGRDRRRNDNIGNQQPIPSQYPTTMFPQMMHMQPPSMFPPQNQPPPPAGMFGYPPPPQPGQIPQMSPMQPGVTGIPPVTGGIPQMQMQNPDPNLQQILGGNLSK